MISEKARQLAYTPEALQKKQETWARKRALASSDVVTLRRRGMVPLAIADKLGLRVETVARLLREQGIAIPPYLTTRDGKRERTLCPHCHKPL